MVGLGSLVVCVYGYSRWQRFIVLASVGRWSFELLQVREFPTVSEV